MSGLPQEDGELKLLVRRAQEGDTEAFGAVYDLYFESIYRYAAFRLPKEVAEDITADVFVRAWQKLHRYKVHRGVPFGAWLFRIARHAVIDAYRNQRGFVEVADVVADPDPMNRADHRTHQSDLLRVVRAAFTGLPKRYREILLLTFVAELPTNAVARVLRLTEGAVRILKLRALRKLKDLLPPEFHA